MADGAPTIFETVEGLFSAGPLRDFASANPLLAGAIALFLVVSALDLILFAPVAVFDGLKALFRRGARADAKAVADRLRLDSGAKFAVLVAPIERDPRRIVSGVLAQALETRLAGFIFDRPVSVAWPSVSLKGAEAAKAARALSARSDADLVIWGRVDRDLARIFFVTGRARDEAGPVQEVRFRPPADAESAERLASGVAYLFARMAVAMADDPDSFRADKLGPVLAALDRLIAEPPADLGPAFEHLLRDDAARIALSLGERREDGEILRRASRLRVRLLAEIDRAEKPLAWARARAGLGEAHLAIGRVENDPRRLDAAIEAFAEAGEAFKLLGDEARRAESLLDLARAHHARARIDRESTHLTAAAQAYRAALKVSPQLSARFEDEARRGLAGALHALAELSGDAAALDQAIDVYRSATSERARALDPVGWSQAQYDLGLAYAAAAQRDGDPRRMKLAVEAFRSALEERPRAKTAKLWADAMNQLGHAFFGLSKLEPRGDALEGAIAAYEQALEERRADESPYEWAQTQNNLGNAYQALGERDRDPRSLKRAVTAYRQALETLSRADYPLEWAGTQNNLGNALQVLGEGEEGGVEVLEAALQAHRQALTVRTKERSRMDWAATRNNVGLVLMSLAERTGERARLEEAVEAFRDALSVFRLAGAVKYAVMAERNLERARSALERKTPPGLTSDRPKRVRPDELV